MKQPDTWERILRIAKKEFLQKGFKGASLQSIVSQAGFTKGAFYGYYPNKAALFDDLVSAAAEGLRERFKAAQQAHFELIPEGRAAVSWRLSGEFLQQFIQYIYDHFDEFKLITCRSEGTKYANYVQELAEMEISVSEQYLETLRQKEKLIGSISRELHSMMTGAFFNAVFETVARDMPREQALAYGDELVAFFSAGMKAQVEFN